MSIFSKVVVVSGSIAIGIMILCTMLAAISVMDTSEPSKTEIYIDEVVDVDKDRIILSNYGVIFARDIERFEWKTGQTYEIKIETYSDRFDYVKSKVVTEAKEVKEV